MFRSSALSRAALLRSASRGISSPSTSVSSRLAVLRASSRRGYASAGPKFTPPSEDPSLLESGGLTLLALGGFITILAVATTEKKEEVKSHSESFLGAIGDAITPVTENKTISDIADTANEKFTKAKEVLSKDASKAVNTVSEHIPTDLSKSVDIARETADDIKGVVTDAVKGAKGLVSKASEQKETVTALANSAVDVARETADDIKDAFSDSVSGAKKLVTKASGQKEAVTSFANDAVNVAKETADDIKGLVNDSVEGAKKFVTKASDKKEDVTSFANDAVNVAKETADDIKGLVNDSVEGAKKLVTKASNKKEDVNSFANSVSDVAKETADELKGAVTDAVEEAKSFATGLSDKTGHDATTLSAAAAEFVHEITDEATAVTESLIVNGAAAAEHLLEEAKTQTAAIAATSDKPENKGAYDPETGDINWDCPCLGGMANGPCGEEFKTAFSCFVYSQEEPKGIECIEKFSAMQNCFREHPDVYAEELRDTEPFPEEQEAAASESIPAAKSEATKA